MADKRLHARVWPRPVYTLDIDILTAYHAARACERRRGLNSALTSLSGLKRAGYVTPTSGSAFGEAGDTFLHLLVRLGTR